MRVYEDTRSQAEVGIPASRHRPRRRLPVAIHADNAFGIVPPEGNMDRHPKVVAVLSWMRRCPYRIGEADAVRLGEGINRNEEPIGFIALPSIFRYFLVGGLAELDELGKQVY